MTPATPLTPSFPSLRATIRRERAAGLRSLALTLIVLSLAGLFVRALAAPPEHGVRAEPAGAVLAGR